MISDFLFSFFVFSDECDLDMLTALVNENSIDNVVDPDYKQPSPSGAEMMNNGMATEIKSTGIYISRCTRLKHLWKWHKLFLYTKVIDTFSTQRHLLKGGSSVFGFSVVYIIEI